MILRINSEINYGTVTINKTNYLYKVKKLTFILFSLFIAINAMAQCSICSKTAAQMGEKPAAGLNSGILYLMLAPFVLIGVIGYRWWKNNGSQSQD